MALAILTSFPSTDVLRILSHLCTNHTKNLARIAVTFARRPWQHAQLVPLLIAALSDTDWHIRWRAVEELAKRKKHSAQQRTARWHGHTSLK